MNIKLFDPQLVKRFERIALIEDIEDVFEKIKDGQTHLQVGDFSVPLQSLRLETFATSDMCCSDENCQTVPSYFAVERTLGNNHPEFSKYHLNLYGTDHKGRETLFTHDHTLARGLGGGDDRDNTTLMCAPCNFNKSRAEGKLVNQQREEQEKINDPEGYAFRKRVEAQRRLQKESKKLENILGAAGHFLSMPQEQLIAHANTQAGDLFVNNKTAYSKAGLTPKGHSWLVQQTMAFFKANKTKRVAS